MSVGERRSERRRRTSPIAHDLATLEPPTHDEVAAQVGAAGRLSEPVRLDDGVRPGAEPPAGSGRATDASAALRSMAEEAGLRRVKVVAWRDLDDPEAGGSELHAHRIASLWAAAGIEVAVRTSAVPGGPEAVRRSGYDVRRRAGRYAVFPAAALEARRLRARPGEALVEIWNGMPFFSPLWYRGPRVVFLHHVHAEMWRMVLPRWLARVGETVERRLAPPLYRRSRVVTLSASSREEIVGMLRIPPDQVSVALPGVEPRFAPGGRRDAEPLVVAVGRLVPVKRFDVLIESLVAVRRHHPSLRAVIIGEGYERPALEALAARHHAEGWLSLPGRLADDEVVEWYRRAWLVASTSQREGWGMTLTEAGACGTPAVASDIAGHRDAVVDGRTGLLVDGAEAATEAMIRLLGDDALRTRFGRAALERSRWFTWDATARATLQAVVTEVAGSS
jgi:glycosyltransferase involved in cell wall biosynthesis